MPNYHKLYTPQDSAVVFIDHQPQMLFGVANADRATLINNVTLLAKVAKEFNVPAVLTAVETEGFSGYVWPQLLDVFPGLPEFRQGYVYANDKPGLGVDLDEAEAAKYPCDSGVTTWTQTRLPGKEKHYYDRAMDGSLRHLADHRDVRSGI